MNTSTTWENVKRKLTSRKFWLAVVGFVTQIMIACGYAESVVSQASAVIMAGAVLIAYIVGEGLTDAASAGGDFIEGHGSDKPAEEFFVFVFPLFSLLRKGGPFLG